jgi:hypothetical protein
MCISAVYKHLPRAKCYQSLPDPDFMRGVTFTGCVKESVLSVKRCEKNTDGHSNASEAAELPSQALPRCRSFRSQELCGAHLPWQQGGWPAHPHACLQKTGNTHGSEGAPQGKLNWLWVACTGYYNCVDFKQEKRGALRAKRSPWIMEVLIFPLWIYSFLNLSSQYHWFWDQCIPESRLIQTPQVRVRFSFNFRHWLILFHQPIAISQRLGLWAILVTP